MDKVFILLMYALGQPNPILIQEFPSASACESKAHFINRKKDQYSAICVPKDQIESV